MAPTEVPTITPEPSITSTPAPTPTPGPIEYLVVDGDTWFGIAEAFGVDAFTLAQFNGQNLEDILNSGETLLIPSAQ